MQLNNSIMLLAIVVLLVGCTIPDRDWFSVDQEPPYDLRAEVLGSWRLASREGSNSVRLADGGGVGLRVDKLTDGMFSTELVADATTTTTVVVRTTPRGEAAGQPGIRLVIGPSATTVFWPDGETTRLHAGAGAKAPIPIRIVNDGHFTNVVVGCDSTGRRAVTAKTTDWVIVRATGGSALLIAPECDVLYPNFQ
ncbi:MAG: hypothetical protein MUC47_05400 [Candidatus Kapabacteria bacterium]|jgi:hypothetical protein|nr:hypothetical protein [Candidatus Kapabacteria bacterium]